jgi:protein KRI1
MMAKSNSDQQPAHPNGVRRGLPEKLQEERPQKRIKALLDDNSSGEEDSISSAGGVPVKEEVSSSNGHGFTVNQEFARRFEHNKKREELQKLEENYPERKPRTKVEERDSESSSDFEEEDDEGVLASEVLDAQIQDTLEAIRRKDPRVYDAKVSFYTELDEEVPNGIMQETKKERPLYLSDYHRKNLLEDAATANAPGDKPTTYAQQQDDLKNVIVKEMHAAANGDQRSGDEGFSDGQNVDEFLVQKPPKKRDDASHNKATRKFEVEDVEAGDKDPETYLSNFMSARAWVPADGTRFQPFESDDEEDDRRAELFEEAYNLRFEDPKTSNEKLLSHARDAAAKYSVRKEDMNPRKKARQAERAKKEAAKEIREEEKARLRKLRVAEAEVKIKKIKDAAGLRGKSLQEEDWLAFLDEGWDDDRWEQEMQKRFGDEYYADYDIEEGNGEESRGKRKVKKPKWEDDIDIGDLVHISDEGEEDKPQFSLTDDESIAGGAPVRGTDIEISGGENFNEPIKSKKKSKRNREKDEQKKTARQERRKIERVVDERMNVDETLSHFSKKHNGHFRYRETSPTGYGLTAQDILMASDSQLNQYAGLKKMAAFRDSDKKRKDKKRLGKKARLRQWRKDTFGNEQGPQKTLANVLAGKDMAESEANSKTDGGIGINQGKKRKPRSRKAKAS